MAYTHAQLARFHASYIPEPNSGCWLWTGPVDRAGYGFFTRYREQHQRAHRASWAIHCEPVPDGMKVCHKCDNRACVNPDHLFLGTQAENVADMIAKGRAKRPPVPRFGEANPVSKYTAEQVREVRTLAAAGKVQSDIARQFGMSPINVSRIVRRLLWSNLP